MVGFLASAILALVTIGTWFAYDVVNPPPDTALCVGFICLPFPGDFALSAEWWMWLISKVLFITAAVGILLFFVVRRGRR